jgi:hypothetical protein
LLYRVFERFLVVVVVGDELRQPLVQYKQVVTLNPIARAFRRYYQGAVARCEDVLLKIWEKVVVLDSTIGGVDKSSYVRSQLGA